MADDKLGQELLKAAQSAQVKEWLLNVRRNMQKYPEIMYREHKTSALVREELARMAVELDGELHVDDKEYAKTGEVDPVTGLEIPGTGVVATIGQGSTAVALPLQEDVQWEHMSQHDGVMHACGHDAHVSMVLGAAKLLLMPRFNSLLQGRVILMFQPAEEGGAGAKRIVEDGALGDATAAFGLHVTEQLPTGYWGSRAGAVTAGTASLATITGEGGHAGLPHNARDPVVATASIIQALQTILSRETDPMKSRILSTGRIQGGNASNVIPNSVEIEAQIILRCMRQAQVYNWPAVVKKRDESYPPHM